MLGHESFGVVEAVGERVRNVKPGDFVTATVRRPGGSIYDQIGTSDMTSEEVYYERGIKDLALGEVMYPGVIQRILTTPVGGLDNYAQMISALIDDNAALKVFVEVAAG